MKHGPFTKMKEWRERDFMGMDEAEVEEDLEEVTDSWYVTLVGGQDIMLVIVRIWRGRHVYIAPCLIMRRKIVLRW